MQISKINVNNYYKNPYFTSSYRTYFPKNDLKDFPIFKKSSVLTTTAPFRRDVNWQELIKYICFNFLNKDRVNIYSLACSDGSEAYTYAMVIKDKLPKNLYKKYFPIFAADIDKEVIKAAKSGKIHLDKIDLANIKKNLKNDFDYFKITDEKLDIKKDIYRTQRTYRVSEELKNSVKFKQSDILTELKNIEDSGNSVVNIRNVLPYLKKPYVKEIFETLSEKLKTGSIYVFGGYDCNIWNLRQILHSYGFFSPIEGAKFVQKK